MWTCSLGDVGLPARRTRDSQPTSVLKIETKSTSFRIKEIPWFPTSAKRSRQKSTRDLRWRWFYCLLLLSFYASSLLKLAINLVYSILQCREFYNFYDIETNFEWFTTKENPLFRRAVKLCLSSQSHTSLHTINLGLDLFMNGVKYNTSLFRSVHVSKPHLIAYWCMFFITLGKLYIPFLLQFTEILFMIIKLLYCQGQVLFADNIKTL